MEALLGENDTDCQRGDTNVEVHGDGDKEGERLYCLCYVSTQVHPMSNEDLVVLLERAREKNAMLGLTGLLLHREGSFFQILEGMQDSIMTLFNSIAKDGRHQRVEIVTEGPVDRREYGDWQMGFVELEGKDFSAMPGFSDILKQSPEAKDFLHSLSRSKKLALLFSIMD